VSAGDAWREQEVLVAACNVQTSELAGKWRGSRDDDRDDMGLGLSASCSNSRIGDICMWAELIWLPIFVHRSIM
jgi:hypothetical protein